MEPQNTQNTQMDIGEDRINLLPKRIIGCALTVLHALGTGFLEKVYENALVHELRKSGLAVSQQHPMVDLKATGLHLCLLLNFGKPRLEIKRVVLALYDTEPFACSACFAVPFSCVGQAAPV
jgi:hypothetical protein